MTGTQFLLIFIPSILVIGLIIDGYRRFVLKKKKHLNYWVFFFLAFFSYFQSWNADYFFDPQQYKRETNDIPQIEKSMQLGYRSRFREKWINSDTSKIQHASKIIKLGQSIEKEIDFFTNEIENKTLRIETTFPMFDNQPQKEYTLQNGIIRDNDRNGSRIQMTTLDEKQKDSLLIEWKLKKQPTTNK
ncbi:MAG: hypothetical protein ABFD10_00475 [Prolixibacteraceae bacterium]